MKYIYTQRESILFNKRVENYDLQGMASIEIVKWIESHRDFFGISNNDMKYIRNYFLGE